MQLWLIPTVYAVASIIGGLALPRLESKYLGINLDLSVSSAQAYLSAVSSGMMALTGIVFSIAATRDSAVSCAALPSRDERNASISSIRSFAQLM